MPTHVVGVTHYIEMCCGTGRPKMPLHTALRIGGDPAKTGESPGIRNQSSLHVLARG